VRRRHQRPAAVEPPWAVLAFLLGYPDESFLAARDEIAGDVRRVADDDVRAALDRFLPSLARDGDTLAACYVETFDLRRRTTLELTWYTHGDTRRRGLALLRLKRLYAAAGLPLATSQLPDHLAVLLAFASIAPRPKGETLLAELRAPIELLRLALHDADSPYAHVLDAVALCLPELSVADRAEVARLVRDGPPDEAVGLEPFAPPEVMPLERTR
jgi:nitrate reductase molybdenum cofactor assembly chaperone NarJ/NarW